MPHRILVIDDEEPIRSMVGEYLGGLGYEVISASDGDQGVEMFRTARPHLALIDFLLPRRNGFAVAEAIRGDAERAETPIIMMSGVFKNPKTAVEAREKYRVIDFLSKPIDLKHLHALIRDALASVDSGDPIDLFADDLLEANTGVEAHDEVPSMDPAPRDDGVLGRGPDSATIPVPSSPVDARVPAVGEDGVFRGRPFPRLEESGAIADFPVALLFSTLRFDAVTGMLDLTDDAIHRRVYVVRGNPTFMQSNAEGENVGALLLRRGRITELDFERCLEHMKERRRTLQQSLLELRLVSENDLATAYKLLAGQLLPIAFGMSRGRFRWRETDAFIGRVPEGKFEGVGILFDGIRRHVHPPQILEFFRGREDLPLVRTTLFDELMPFFRRAFSASNIASKVDGSSTYRMIARQMSNHAVSVVPQLYALVTSGMAVLPRLTEEISVDIAVKSAAREAEESLERLSGDVIVEHLDVSASGEEKSSALEVDLSVSGEARRASAAIARYYGEIVSKNFFEIFGADRTTDLDRIKATYFELARSWGPDAFTGVELGASRQRLTAIFQRITEAYETITDRRRREEYSAYLDRKARGVSTEAADLLRADKLFDQAQAMLLRRDWNGARGLLADALALLPGDPLYVATLGWVTFNLDPNAEANVARAVELLETALEQKENLPVAHQYLAQIRFARGLWEDARSSWKRCLALEPGNPEAIRGMRMLEQNVEKESMQKSGLLGRFLGKKP